MGQVTPYLTPRTGALDMGAAFRIKGPKPWIDATAAPYNAKGDGATDDKAALQAAIDAAYNAGGGRVYLPRGTYLISGNLRVKAGVELFGDGPESIIKCATGTANYIPLTNQNHLTTGDSNITLRDLTIDANRQNRTIAGDPGGWGVALRISSDQTTGGQCEDIAILRVTIKNVPHAAMQLMRCKRLRVEGCTISDTLRDGITVWRDSEEVLIRGNRLSDIRDDCIALNSEAETSGHGFQVRNAVIADNICEQAADATLGNGIRIAGAANVTCHDNLIPYTQGAGLLVEGGDATGGGDATTALLVTVAEVVPGVTGVSGETQSVTLSGATDARGSFQLQFLGALSAPISSGATAAEVQTALEAVETIGAGNVSVTGAAGGPWTVVFQGALGLQNVYLMSGKPTATARQVSVRGNVVERCGTSVNNSSAISVGLNAEEVLLQGNVLRGFYGNGVTVNAPGVQVAGNRITGGRGPNSDGISLASAAQRCGVHGNTVEFVPRYGINLGSSRNSVSGNTVNDAGFRATGGQPHIFIANGFNTVAGNVLRNQRQVGYGIRINVGAIQGVVATGNVTMGWAEAFAVADSSNDPTLNTLANNIRSGGP